MHTFNVKVYFEFIFYHWKFEPLISIQSEIAALWQNISSIQTENKRNDFVKTISKSSMVQK